MRRPDRNTILTAIGLVIASAAYLRSAITAPISAHRILVPADQPVAVCPPMRVDVLDDQGGRGIRIPDNVGRGWCGEACGSAIYYFYVPATGRTRSGLRASGVECVRTPSMLKSTVCPRAILGNDPIFSRWHWVRGAAWPMVRGTHLLRLSNHSDGIAIRRLALLADPLDRPETDAPVFFDLFYDGFDGCGGGNIAAWTLSSGWKLTELNGERDYSRRALAGRSSGSATPIVAVVGEESWHDYAVDMSIRMMVPGHLAVACGYRGPGDCVQVEWTRATHLRVVRYATDQASILGEWNVSLPQDRWTAFSLTARDGQLVVSLDGVPACRVALAPTAQWSACLDARRRGVRVF